MRSLHKSNLGLQLHKRFYGAEVQDFVSRIKMYIISCQKDQLAVYVKLARINVNVHLSLFNKGPNQTFRYYLSSRTLVTHFDVKHLSHRMTCTDDRDCANQ